MIRGTTPDIVLHLPQSMSFDELYITFAQNNVVVMEKTLDDVTVNGSDITISLTQAETLALTARNSLNVQIRGKIGEEAYASRIQKLSNVDDIYKDGEI